MRIDTRGVQITNGSKNPDDEHFFIIFFLWSPYAWNWVCRSSLDFGAKRGCPGAVVYSDGFSVEKLRVPVRCTGFG